MGTKTFRAALLEDRLGATQLSIGARPLSRSVSFARITRRRVNAEVPLFFATAVPSDEAFFI